MDKENEKTLVQKSESVACFHCGESCRSDHLVFEGKDFCCQGCKTVYEILRHNDLCEYYDFEKHPGFALKSAPESEKFLFLENKEITGKLLDFSSDQLNKVTFFIPKIHCSSCIWLLENLHHLQPGIINSRVNFTKKTVSIDYNPGDTNLRGIANLLASIGYEPYISLDD
jgi:P-type Cu+ transporter